MVPAMTHLLDTDHVSILERRGAEYSVIRGHMAKHSRGDVGASVVSVQEQSRGFLNLLNQARTPAQTLIAYDLVFNVINFFRYHPLVEFDAAAWAEFEQLKAMKLGVGTLDLRIAAIAKVRNLIVVTRNKSDFGKVPNLRIEDWTR
jgi:tRNA(fMet)-specific endonuclease VapC